MGVSTADLMKLIRGGASDGKASMEIEVEEEGTEGEEGMEKKPALSGASSPPMSSPMSTPEPKKGEEMQGRIDVQLGMGMLMGAMQKFPDGSPEQKAVKEVIGKLGSTFGEMDYKAKELVPAEILQMIQTLPQAGGASAEMRAMAAAPTPGTQNPPLPI
jgi:hypothetical protein